MNFLFKVVLIVAVVAVSLYYLKFNKQNDDAMMVIPTTQSATELEVEDNFKKIAEIHKNGDVESFIAYWKEAGFEFEENSIKKENLQLDYSWGFKDVVENSFPGLKKEYKYGEYEDGSEYIELIYSGYGEEDVEVKKITHTFDVVEGKIFWSSYEVSIKGEGPVVPPSDLRMNIGL